MSWEEKNRKINNRVGEGGGGVRGQKLMGQSGKLGGQGVFLLCYIVNMTLTMNIPAEL